MTNWGEVWRSYSVAEKKNIAFYFGGIMFYKLGLEFFNGAIISLAADRFTSRNAFTKLGAAQGINQAAQCVGAILIAPLIGRWPTRTVLSTAILIFGLMTIILLVVDAATGGRVKPAGSSNPVYGNWNPDAIFVIWTLSGIAYGMVELIRRIIPADIVGGHVGKLRRMDALVHVVYEVAGTGAAFASSWAISRFGNNYSFFLTPIFFALAGFTWCFVSVIRSKNQGVVEQACLGDVDCRPKGALSYLVQVLRGVVHFGRSICLGTKIVLGNRRFVWLLPSYALALYLHRFLESSLAPCFAKRVLGNSAWSQIIVGGSNFGELLGALSVFILSDYVTTPMPWLRLDAVMLNIVWILPYFATFATHDVVWAWEIAGLFIPISLGWAAGDVSLAAYIQASLTDSGYNNSGVSALGAVMAFLYSAYIVAYAILSAVLGTVVDRDFWTHGNINHSLTYIAGVQFTTCSVIILLATLIPIGSFALNPKVVGGVPLQGEPVQVTNTVRLEKARSDGTLKRERSHSHGTLKHGRNYDTDSSSEIFTHPDDNKFAWGFAV